MRLETIKFLEEYTGSNYSDISPSNIFLDISPKARKTKANIKYIKYKAFAQQRKQSTKLKE